MRLRLTITWTTIAIVAVVGVIALAGLFVAEEHFTSKSEFCGGSCHTMTEQYTAWKSSKHNASNNENGTQAECIECHFLPGEKKGFKAKMEGLRHLAAYLYNPDAPLPIRPVVKDGSCLQSGCHATSEFADTEIQYTEKVRFIHAPHLGDKALQGQNLTCDTCHFKVTAEQHFEVPNEICALCHLNLEKPTLDLAVTEVVTIDDLSVERISFDDNPSINFNEGLSKCDNCHSIPTASLQSQFSAGESNVKSITHQSIREAGVSCESCHFEVVKGSGEVNTGNVVSNGCLTCHNRSEEMLATADDETLMHDEHVAKRTADCFDCHAVIEHKNREDHLDFVREDCALCHQDQHKYQKLLLAGIPIAEGISAQPNLMYEVNTNCMACHLQKTQLNGHAVRTGAPETCAACHTPRHKDMLADWKEQVEEEITAADELAIEAIVALKTAEANGGETETLAQARMMIDAGAKYLEVVRIGNGVHNKKYAITILDEAFVNFEDAVDLLDGGG